MRSQIAYALIALTFLLALGLVAASHALRRSRLPKHLRIDLLSEQGEAGKERKKDSSGGDFRRPRRPKGGPPMIESDSSSAPGGSGRRGV